MKRKTFSVLLALVLALSLCLVTAVPVAADPGTLNVAPFELIIGGTGTAEWSDAEYHTGSYSVKLTAPASTGDYGKVVMPLDMEFEDFADFSVWVEGGSEAAQALPLHDIKAVVDDVVGVTLPASNKGTGEDVDLQNKIVVLASQPGQSEGIYEDTLMSDGIDGWEKYGTHTDATINVGTGAYWSIFVYSAGYVYEACYDYYTWDEIHSVLDGKATVTEVRIELRYPQDPADVDSTVYVDDIAINGVTYYGLIQDAIDAAIASDTISVAAGTYTENVDVDEEVTLTGASSATVTVTALDAAVSVFTVTASNVAISGFTITGCTGPWTQEDMYAGIRFPAHVEGCNIHDNILTDNIVGILMIDTENTTDAGGNTFTNNNASTNIVSGIEMQHTYGNTFISNTANSGVYGFNLDSARNNTFTGNTANSNSKYGFFLVKGDGTTGSDYNTFTDNTANLNTRSGIRMTNLSGNATYTGNTFNSNVIAGMELGGTAGDATSNLTVNNNTFSGNATGILIDTGAVITDVVLRNNSIVGNTTAGITVGADATGVTVNYNEITGNIVGVQNDDTGVELDAQYNWWGGVAGPFHANNPYEFEADSQSNDSVSDDVDFLPWMIHDTLVSGWNIWSTPIAAATGYEGEPDTNTVEEALDFWDADSSKVIDAYYFDSSTQAWVVPPSLTPLQAVYLNLSAAATIDVCVSDSNYAPPGRTMHLGWNLVGTADWDDDKLVNVALDAAFYGTGAVNLEGYQYVISPSIHQTSWTFTRGGTVTNKYFVPTCGYWVYMVNQGVLNGFTYTPILEVAP